ncbi:MAG: ferrous iron transport protein A [Acidobacteria bacterium]|nr:ferrous iron transport protein A [Acidobacteriota bacterium]MYC82448.1 ferrous iron transport protein A [Acidobacteriota bacterium]
MDSAPTRPRMRRIGSTRPETRYLYKLTPGTYQPRARQGPCSAKSRCIVGESFFGVEWRWLAGQGRVVPGTGGAGCGFQLLRMRFRKEMPARTLSDLRQGDEGVLDRLEVVADVAERLMELGFLPGVRVSAGRPAPGGDPMIFRVDGSEVAIRRATARRLILSDSEQVGEAGDYV